MPAAKEKLIPVASIYGFLLYKTREIVLMDEQFLKELFMQVLLNRFNNHF